MWQFKKNLALSCYFPHKSLLAYLCVPILLLRIWTLLFLKAISPFYFLMKLFCIGLGSLEANNQELPNFYLISGERLPVKCTRIFLKKVKLSFEWEDLNGNRAPFEIKCKDDFSDLPFIQIEKNPPQNRELFPKECACITASIIKETKLDYQVIFLIRSFHEVYDEIDFELTQEDLRFRRNVFIAYIAMLLCSWSPFIFEALVDFYRHIF